METLHEVITALNAKVVGLNKIKFDNRDLCNKEIDEIIYPITSKLGFYISDADIYTEGIEIITCRYKWLPYRRSQSVGAPVDITFSPITEKHGRDITIEQYICKVQIDYIIKNVERLKEELKEAQQTASRLSKYIKEEKREQRLLQKKINSSKK